MRPADLRALARLVDAAARTVDRLYETGRLCAAEDLDALLSVAEELLEDVGDGEEGCDRENDFLSEVDEDGARSARLSFPSTRSTMTTSTSPTTGAATPPSASPSSTTTQTVTSLPASRGERWSSPVNIHFPSEGQR